MADSHPAEVDPSNAEQADDWDGEGGDYWAGHQDEFERLLEVFDPYLVEAARLDPDDRVLDIGCGTGATSRALALRTASGAVVGIDLSSGMLGMARRSADAAGLRNVHFVRADAQVHAFADPFDVAVSRLGCMFFGDPAAAFATIAQSLRPEGRLVLLTWRATSENAWLVAIDDALDVGPDSLLPTTEAPAEPATSVEPYEPGPFSLADAEQLRTLLDGAGFVDVVIAPLDVPLNLGTRAEAEAFLLSWMEEDIDEVGRERAVPSLQRMVQHHETEAGVLLGSATWLVTARRPV